MATKRAAATVAREIPKEERSKAELQRRMEEAREDISSTVAEIKDTVTDALDWREQFRKHAVAWSLGALALGYVVGSGVAATLKGTPKGKRRKGDGVFSEILALGESLSEELSGVAHSILLPVINKKLKDEFGIDLSETLLRSAPEPKENRVRRSPARKTVSKKRSSRKTSATKSVGRKSTPRKKRR